MLTKTLMGMQGRSLFVSHIGQEIGNSTVAKCGSKANASLASCPQVPSMQWFPLPHTLMRQLLQD